MIFLFPRWDMLVPSRVCIQTLRLCDPLDPHCHHKGLHLVHLWRRDGLQIENDIRQIQEIFCSTEATMVDASLDLMIIIWWHDKTIMKQQICWKMMINMLILKSWWMKWWNDDDMMQKWWHDEIVVTLLNLSWHTEIMVTWCWNDGEAHDDEISMKKGWWSNASEILKTSTEGATKSLSLRVNLNLRSLVLNPKLGDYSSTHTVDGWNPAITSWGNGSLSHYLLGFIHPWWYRISEPSTVWRVRPLPLKKIGESAYTAVFLSKRSWEDHGKSQTLREERGVENLFIIFI